MNFEKLEVSYRKTFGKGPARRMRKQGLAPGIVYGRGIDNAVPIAVDPRTLIKALHGPKHMNTVLQLTVKDAPEGVKSETYVMVRDHAFEPVSRDLLHVDFVTIDEDHPIRVKVPLKLTGRCIGIQLGGKLRSPFRELPLECLPQNIPEEITLDITSLNVNQQITVGDVKLPEKTRITLPDRMMVVSIMAGGAGAAGEAGEEASAGEATA